MSDSATFAIVLYVTVFVFEEAENPINVPNDIPKFAASFALLVAVFVFDNTVFIVSTSVNTSFLYAVFFAIADADVGVYKSIVSLYTA